MPGKRIIDAGQVTLRCNASTDLIRRADENAYRAKQSGGNKVELTA